MAAIFKRRIAINTQQVFLAVLVGSGVVFLVLRAKWKFVSGRDLEFNEVPEHQRLMWHRGNQKKLPSENIVYRQVPVQLSEEDLSFIANDSFEWMVHGQGRDFATSMPGETLASTIKRVGGDPTMIFRIDKTRTTTFVKETVTRFDFSPEHLNQMLGKVSKLA